MTTATASQVNGSASSAPMIRPWERKPWRSAIGYVGVHIVTYHAKEHRQLARVWTGL